LLPRLCHQTGQPLLPITRIMTPVVGGLLLTITKMLPSALGRMYMI